MTHQQRESDEASLGPELPSRSGEARSLKRTLAMLGVTSAVLALLVVSFGVHRLVGSGESVERDAASASASAPSLDAQRAALLERVAAKRAELDRMIGKLVPIPGGKLRMGDNDGNLNERPEHDVDVAAFEIDEIEVSVAAYQLCVAADECTKPGTDPGCNWWQPDRRGHPINCIDWNQAFAFCKWAAKRLPSESEWEWAARGPKASRYPWGEQAPEAQLCWKRGEGDAGGLGTCPSAGLPAGQSIFGVRSMAGNVREWTAAAFCPYARPDCRSSSLVIRGGAWSDKDPLGVRAALRNNKPHAYRSASVGFRCARDVLAGK